MSTRPPRWLQVGVLFAVVALAGCNGLTDGDAASTPSVTGGPTDTPVTDVSTTPTPTAEGPTDEPTDSDATTTTNTTTPTATTTAAPDSPAQTAAPESSSTRRRADDDNDDDDAGRDGGRPERSPGVSVSASATGSAG